MDFFTSLFPDSRIPTRAPTPDLEHDDDDDAKERIFRFFDLPAEIRLQIYDKLLVRRARPGQTPESADIDPAPIMIPVFRTSHFATLELQSLNPTILRTCRRIYDEAIGILYSRNVFMTTDAHAMRDFLSQIGPSNVKLVRSIVLRIDSGFSPSRWGILIHTMAELPTGLRYLQVCWRTKGEYPWEVGRPDIGRGLGASLKFVRELAKIRGLEKLVLEGFYAKNWPAYLREQTGAEVQEIVGLSWSSQDLRERVKMYQQATEHLIP